MKTSDEIVERIRAQQLVPIRLATDPAADDDSFWEFDGSLDEFLAAVGAIGTRAVFVVGHTFYAEFLEFSNDDHGAEAEPEGLDVDPDDDESETTEPIDLVAMEPRLEPYRARAGELYCVSVLALAGAAKLRLDLNAPWYDEFCALRDPTVERLEASEEERELAQEAAREKQRQDEEAKVARDLDSLPANPAFRDLRTKAAMIAYVDKHFPSAKDVLGPVAFREKVTALYQRAQLERSRR
jgi:hypothetical protein